MKKYICLLLVMALCFGIVGCGGSYDSVNIDKEPEIFDFHIPDWVSWGMKEGEVRQHFENERIYDMGISTAVIQISQEDMYRDSFVDESYHFGSSNSLYKMEYVFEKSYDPTDLHANQYYEIYSEIKQKMLEEYGEPIEDKETWHNDRYKDDPQMMFKAVDERHYTASISWELENCTCTMTLEDFVGTGVVISYTAN